MRKFSALVAVVLIAATVVAAPNPDGVRRIKLLLYPDCIELSNAHTTVVLGHRVGGRVLKSAWRGVDALNLSPDEAKWDRPNRIHAPKSAPAGSISDPKCLSPNATSFGPVLGQPR